MITSLRSRAVLLLAILTLSTAAHAQYSSGHGTGWEGGLDVIYQNATTLNFKGGTTANIDTDWAIGFTVGYRVNPHIDALFGMDWQHVDYRANLALGTGGIQPAYGDYQAFTPRFNVELNLLDRPFTPYAVAGIGYSFIDTNIPSGRPQTGCWWDPWYGYICTTVQSTRQENGVAYQVGAGVRWDVATGATVRLAFERHWVDLGGNVGTPGFDQIRLLLSWRYF
jgi:opacity protein-like surface antigen